MGPDFTVQVSPATYGVNSTTLTGQNVRVSHGAARSRHPSIDWVSSFAAGICRSMRAGRLGPARVQLLRCSLCPSPATAAFACSGL